MTKKVLFLLSILAICAANNAHAVTCTWTGQQNTDWFNPMNWSCGQVPGATDSVILATTANIPVLNSSTAIRSLNITQNATLNGTGQLTISGYLRAVSVTAQFQPEIVVTGQVVSSAADFKITTRPFRVSGPATFNHGSLTMTGTGIFDVTDSGSATFIGQVNIFGFVSDTTFWVHGELIKDGGGVLDFEAAYAFHGATINIKQGSISNYFLDGSNVSSIFNSSVSIQSAGFLSAYRTLNVVNSTLSGTGIAQVYAPGNFVVSQNSQIQCAVYVYGGLFNISQGFTTVPSLRIEGGSFTAANARINGALYWKKGSLNGAIEVSGITTIEDSGGAVEDKMATGLTLSGNATYSGNDRLKGNINVNPNVLFQVNATQNIDLNASINLRGTLSQTGKDTLTFSGFLLHYPTGTLSGKGTMKMTGGHIVQGHIAPGNGIDTLTIKQNTVSLQQGATLDFEINGALHDKLYVKNNITLAGSTLNLTEISSAPAGTYILVEASGVVSGTFASVNLPPGYIVTYNSNRVNVVKSASAPIANFTISSALGCVPFTAQFTNTSANATDFLWSFPGGSPSTSTLPNPVVTYYNTGFYDVSLLASNTVGSSSKVLPNFIEVRVPAQAAFTTIVNDATVTCTNNSTDAWAYVWDFGDGATSTDINPTHTYALDGTYLIRLGAVNACDTFYTSQTVSVIAPPIPDFTSNVASGCAPLSVQFINQTANQGANITYQWAFEGGSPATSTDANPTVSFATPGLYGVTLTATNSVGAVVVEKANFIEVKSPPEAVFGAFITGNSVFFSNQSQNAQTWQWNFGDGESSQEQSPTHLYTAPGFYTVTLTATGICGNDVEQQTVVIVGPPEADFMANATEICPGDTVWFTNLSQNAATWNWLFPGGSPDTSTVFNPSVVYATPGNYSVTLNAFNNSGSTSAMYVDYIHVLPLPTANFIAEVDGYSVTLFNASMNGDALLWNFGDGTTSTDINPAHTYASPGSYVVHLTATNACGQHDYEIGILIQESSAVSPDSGPVHILPNPNDGRFDVRIPGGTKVEKITLIGPEGRLIQQVRSTETSDGLWRMDINGVPAGVYLLNILTDRQMLTTKVIVRI